MNSTSIWVDDMHCSACTSKIEQALKRMTGIGQIRVNPLSKQVHVTHDQEILPQDILHSIESIGFNPQLASQTGANQDAEASSKLLKRVGVSGICMMQIMMIQIALYAGAIQDMTPLTATLLSYAGLLMCLPIVCYAALPFFHKGLIQPFTERGGFLRNLNMDTPIASAILLAFGASFLNTLNINVGGAATAGTTPLYPEVYYDSVAMFAFLMLATRYIDARLRGKLSFEASLISTLPATCAVLEQHFLEEHDGQTKHVQTSVAEVQPGAQIWVKSGETIPLDGLLVSDTALVDEALLTGESAPITHRKNDEVFAGTINTGSGIQIHVTHALDQTQLARMDEIASQAAGTKPATLKITDTIARIFVPAILLLGATVYLVWSALGHPDALEITLAVLIISCPCALSLAVPAAINAGIGKLRRLGVLIKNPFAIDQARHLHRVHFDKTGTLTSPDVALAKITVKGHLTEQECLQTAAALQVHTTHPLAKPFHRHYQYDAEHVQVINGQGVMGTLDGQQVKIGSLAFCKLDAEADNSSVDSNPHPKDVGRTRAYLCIDGCLHAVFEYDHPLREDAADVIRELKSMGIDSDIISGDQASACAEVADQLDIPYHNSVTPETKQKLTQAQQGLFVGDGLNDLIAMSSASVSMATIETVDLVKSKADVILLSAKLGGIPKLFKVSHEVNKVVRQNLGWALLYNVIAIPIACLGLAPAWLAAAGMSASSLLVLGNAMRILRQKESG